MTLKRQKEEIRNAAKAERRKLSAWDIEKKGLIIRDKVLSEIKDCRCIMIYISKEPEVETLDLTERFIADGKKVVVPIIEKDTGTLRLSELKNTSVLVKSTFGVPEPVDNEIPVGREEPDAITVPMLAFDRTGSRLGYGAGYYDRFFSGSTDAKIIGIAF